MIDVKEVGKRIREVRGKMNQTECAEKLGISRAALSYYENGSRAIDTTVLCEFCKLFNVSSDYILGISEAKTTDEDIKTACKTANLPESTIERLRSLAESMGDYSKEALPYIIESKQFTNILITFAKTRQLKKFLFSDKYSSSSETINAYLDELNIEQSGRVGSLMIGFILNGGIEPVFKHTLSEDLTKLFDEYKEYILSRQYYAFPVCLYPKSEGGYTVTVPDLPEFQKCSIEQESMLEALEGVTAAVTAFVAYAIKHGDEIPEPTPIDEVKADEYKDGFTRMITLDIPKE